MALYQGAINEACRKFDQQINSVLSLTDMDRGILEEFVYKTIRVTPMSAGDLLGLLYQFVALGGGEKKKEGKYRKCNACNGLVTRKDERCPKCHIFLCHDEYSRSNQWFDITKSESMMSRCKHCNCYVKDSDKFCERCGKQNWLYNTPSKKAKTTIGNLVYKITADTTEFEKAMKELGKTLPEKSKQAAHKPAPTMEEVAAKAAGQPAPLRWDHTKDTILPIPGSFQESFEELQAAVDELKKEVFGVIKQKALKLNNRCDRIYKRLSEKTDGTRTVVDAMIGNITQLTARVCELQNENIFGERLNAAIKASERRMGIEIEKSEDFMGRQIKKYRWQERIDQLEKTTNKLDGWQKDGDLYYKDAIQQLSERIDQLEKDNKALVDFMNHHNKGTYPQGQYMPLGFKNAGIIAREHVSKEYQVPFDYIIVNKTTLCTDHYIVELTWHHHSSATVRIEIENQKPIIVSSQRSAR